MRSKTIAILSLSAYAWLGLGVGAQLVFCIGADGHSGIERMHGPAPCDASGEHSPERSLGSSTCTDIPLMVRASVERERLCDRNVFVSAVAAAPSCATSHARSRHPARHVLAWSGPITVRTSILRL